MDIGIGVSVRCGLCVKYWIHLIPHEDMPESSYSSVRLFYAVRKFVFTRCLWTFFMLSVSSMHSSQYILQNMLAR